jgi:hypothetical protein
VNFYSLAERRRRASVEVVASPEPGFRMALKTTAPRALGRALAAFTAAASFAGSPALSASMSDTVAGVCTRVVGLSPGEKHFVACVQSLSHSLQGLHRVEDATQARQACLARGYAPRSPGLAECELAALPGMTSAPGPAGQTSVPGGSQSYFTVSKRTAYERDQLACARLGFEPAAGAFDDCVADLRAALAEASTSMM